MLSLPSKGIDMEITDSAYFKDWNYKKHAKLCIAVYAVLLAIDMTVGYLLAKKILPKIER